MEAKKCGQFSHRNSQKKEQSFTAEKVYVEVEEEAGQDQSAHPERREKAGETGHQRRQDDRKD